MCAVNENELETTDDGAGSVEVCVIGAGFAGLTLGAALEAAGTDYLVLDKGRSPGGRAATRRMDSARVDHGIPWLTRTGGESDGLIDRLRRAGLIERLFVGGSVGDAWIAPAGITSTSKYLAEDLNVRFSHRVESVEAGDPNQLTVTGADGAAYELTARHVVITAPVPQAIEMAPAIAEELKEIDPEEVYEKAVLGLARLAHSGEIPDQALFENPAAGISSVIVESAKFPDRPPSVSIRCDPAASETLFDATDEEAWRWMAGQVSGLAFLEGEPEERQVKRWRYSKPAEAIGSPYLAIRNPGRLDLRLWRRLRHRIRNRPRGLTRIDPGPARLTPLVAADSGRSRVPAQSITRPLSV